MIRLCRDEGHQDGAREGNRRGRPSMPGPALPAGRLNTLASLEESTEKGMDPCCKKPSLHRR
ncbi:MAG: hypothetical protein MZV70_59435 [Desulfobacterales bacterium]|nr:hypothetical protein [Desulfobacterales bacterium]